jgi:Tol biopolymer transport system component
LVSVRSGGGFTGLGSRETAMSADGRYVAFASLATDLVPDGLGGLASAVFLEDRRTGTAIRMPLAAQVPGSGNEAAPSMSADGSVVAFTYTPATAGNIPAPIVMAWDRASGTTTVVSVYSDGFAFGSREPAVSGNGRFVAFTSDTEGIVPNDGNGLPDVFRYDRQAGTTDLVSVAFTGKTAATAGASHPAINGDGSIVAFVSAANDTLLAQNNGQGAQVFVRDMNAGVTRLQSMAADGSPANGAASDPSLADDGQALAFDSAADNLLPGLTGSPSQAYRRNLATGALDLVSMTPSGGPWPNPSGLPAISRDGRMVAFESIGLAGVTGGIAFARRYPAEIYLRDLVAQQTALITVTLAGTAANAYSYAPSVDGSGRRVAFDSTSPDLVAGDGNKVSDVFIRDLPPAPRLNPATIDFGVRALGSPPTPLAATLANVGWGPMPAAPATVTGGAAADFPVQADGCAARVLYRGDVCTVTVGFVPTAKGPRSATLQVTAVGGGFARQLALTGNGSQAQIVLDPPVGQQGIVTIAHGSGFPPGAQLTLAWSLGITQAMPPVTADQNGAFTVGVLVFHNDIVGPRGLVATSVGGTTFPTLSTSMLVTPRPMTPPGFAVPGRLLINPFALLMRG